MLLHALNRAHALMGWVALFTFLGLYVLNLSVAADDDDLHLWYRTGHERGPG